MLKCENESDGSIESMNGKNGHAVHTAWVSTPCVASITTEYPLVATYDRIHDPYILFLS